MKKKKAIRPSLTQWRRLLLIEKVPIVRESSVCQKE